MFNQGKICTKSHSKEAGFTIFTTIKDPKKRAKTVEELYLLEEKETEAFHLNSKENKIEKLLEDDFNKNLSLKEIEEKINKIDPKKKVETTKKITKILEEEIKEEIKTEQATIQEINKRFQEIRKNPIIIEVKSVLDDIFFQLNRIIKYYIVETKFKKGLKGVKKLLENASNLKLRIKKQIQMIFDLTNLERNIHVLREIVEEIDFIEQKIEKIEQKYKNVQVTRYYIKE